MARQQRWYGVTGSTVIVSEARKRDVIERLDAKHERQPGLTRRLRHGMYEIRFPGAVYWVCNATEAAREGWLPRGDTR